MNKKEIIIALERRGLKNPKVRFYKKSPFMKHRYKDQFVESEAWIGRYVITDEMWNNVNYRNNYLEMIVEDLKH